MIPNLYLGAFILAGISLSTVLVPSLQADTPRPGKIQCTDTGSNLGPKYANSNHTNLEFFFCKTA
jgi:hypothetical protein